MDLDNLKQTVFGSTVRPAFSQDTLLQVLFWPDAFLGVSLLLAVAWVVALAWWPRKPLVIPVASNAVSRSAVHLVRGLCFAGLVGAASATLRLSAFIFGSGSESHADQAAVTLFSALFLIPTALCAALALVCAWALHRLFGARLRP